MKKKWYEVSEQERLRLFSEYSIKDFFDWWSDNEKRVMEIRIMDYPLIREIAEKFNVPYSKSGVYVNNSRLLKSVIGYVRNKTSCWFGVNSKRSILNRWGNWRYSGKDENISEIGYIFIDIDRIKSHNKPATSLELKKADKLADLILLALSKQNWAESYCKICSGNGVQLLIKLDIFIRLPKLVYNKKQDRFEYNPEFERCKDIIRNGFGDQLLKFASKFKKKLGVVVDKSVFNIGRVAALPYTKNYKYGGYTWRGIIDLKDGVNKGLTDYLVSSYKPVNSYNKKKIFTKPKGLLPSEIITVKQLRNHQLVKLMLNPDLVKGTGHINNVLWFMLKCLIRDNNIDITSKEFKKLHKELEKNYGNVLTLNLPKSSCQYSTNPINNYCRKHLFPPVLPLWENVNILDIKFTEFNFKESFGFYAQQKKIVYENIEDPLKACLRFKEEHLNGNDLDYNRTQIACFTAGMVDMYGKDVAEYYAYYYYDKIFNYRKKIDRCKK